MKYVPVVSSSGKPLMPCHPARARELVRAGRAKRRFNKGLFYIQLTDRADGDVQPIVIGIDPGSKKEALTVKSGAHTFLNIQADAVTWVSKHIEQRRLMRRNRRRRNCPHRANRKNRARGCLPPSVKARWQWKLRLVNWLRRIYPVTDFVVEDIKARIKAQRQWDSTFSPLETGKRWFYAELGKLGLVNTLRGYETKAQRDALGLKKSSQKLSDKFEAHCVDSWVLANWWIGGHTVPEDKAMLFVTPLQFHPRQLHVMQPAKGGVRKLYGGTRSMGFKRGSWVKHPKWGLCYVGGTADERISLYSLSSGKRLCQNAKPAECTFLCYSSFRLRKEKAQSVPGRKLGIPCAE